MRRNGYRPICGNYGYNGKASGRVGSNLAPALPDAFHSFSRMICSYSRSRKRIISDYGECEIAVPWDRNGEFEPQIIEKRQTRTSEIEDKILAMYAKGMSQRDIEETIREFMKPMYRKV